MLYFHCFSFTHVFTTFFANDSFFYHRPSQWEHFSSTLSTWCGISHWGSFVFKLPWILSVWMCPYFSPHFWNKGILLNIKFSVELLSLAHWRYYIMPSNVVFQFYLVFYSCEGNLSFLSAFLFNIPPLSLALWSFSMVCLNVDYFLFILFGICWISEPVKCS